MAIQAACGKARSVETYSSMGVQKSSVGEVGVHSQMYVCVCVRTCMSVFLSVNLSGVTSIISQASVV